MKWGRVESNSLFLDKSHVCSIRLEWRHGSNRIQQENPDDRMVSSQIFANNFPRTIHFLNCVVQIGASMHLQVSYFTLQWRRWSATSADAAAASAMQKSHYLIQDPQQAFELQILKIKEISMIWCTFSKSSENDLKLPLRILSTWSERVLRTTSFASETF